MRLLRLGVVAAAIACALALATCTKGDGSSEGTSSRATISTGTGFDGQIGKFCKLPGSRQVFPDGTVNVVPGAPSGTPDLSWLTIPPGYCVHYYGAVGNTRQIRFAPGGELFVASPATCTTGGEQPCPPLCCYDGCTDKPACGGAAQIVVLPDDDGDGFADKPVVFLSNLPSTQGILFANDSFYYQDDTYIRRLPYKAGERKPEQPSGDIVVNIDVYTSTVHWPKTLDVADDGTIFVANGGDQNEVCDPSRPFHGGILKIDGSSGGAQVAKGLRNPIAIRCQHGHDLCFAAELALDYSWDGGGREKLFVIKQGDDWGFPCCATQNLPYAGGNADCSKVASEAEAFLIGETPFAFDFEPGLWPKPYTNSIFIPLHGTAGMWTGARVVALAVDEKTGLPLAGSDIGGTSTGALSDFALGWEDHHHGRPATITFAPDGRMFLGNDNDGSILWIAPLGLN